MDPARFTRVDPTTWRIEPHGAMRVPAVIYADEDLIRDMDDKVFEQAANVATLPGIVQASYAMPDAHWGYGFPIGGVAAFDPDQGGVVSAGGVGFDISCGVRTMLTGLTVADVVPVQKIAGRLAVPPNSGRRRQQRRDHPRRRRHGRDALGGRPLGGRARLGRSARPRTDRGGGRDGGCAAGVCLRPRQGAAASRDGHARLRQPLSRGPGGGRNLRRGCRPAFGLAPERGGRHHPLRLARPRSPDRNRVPEGHGGERRRRRASTLPDRELACAPINSEVGQRYLGAMRAAINCALANREILGHYARRLFAHFFPNCDLRLLFDVSHNTCKVEPHHGRWEVARAIRSSKGCDAGVRARSREPAGGAACRSASRC